MKRIIALLLCSVLPITLFGADTGYKVKYDGGSIPDVKSGADLKLYIEAARLRFVKDKSDVITIPAATVTEISYGQDVHRRAVRPSV